LPFAGPTGKPMGVYMVPPVGAGVWVEFEHGDSNHPIWTGCRWGGESDVPPSAFTGSADAPNVVIQTQGQHMLMLSDAPSTATDGGIVLRSAKGVKLIVNDSGIYVENTEGTKITLVGPELTVQGTTVKINDDALVVI
jgi:uncharacterized protein involved in type VI secretion and phage assembly